MLYGDGSQHLVLAARKRGQHAAGIVGIGRLAKNAAIQRHRGVRAQHGRHSQGAARMAGHGGIELERGDALHIVARCLIGQLGLYGLGIFGNVALSVGQQKLMGHTQLLQQLAAAGALGGKVDEWRHDKNEKCLQPFVAKR